MVDDEEIMQEREHDGAMPNRVEGDTRYTYRVQSVIGLGEGGSAASFWAGLERRWKPGGFY